MKRILFLLVGLMSMGFSTSASAGVIVIQQAPPVRMVRPGCVEVVPMGPYRSFYRVLPPRACGMAHPRPVVWHPAPPPRPSRWR